MQTWNSLLRELYDALDELVEDFVGRVKAVPPYDSGIITDTELYSAATRSLEVVVSALSDSRQYRQVEKYARELGETRASQGLPAEALTTAVRLNFPVIWSKLLELVEPSFLPSLTKHAETVWLVLDNYAVACYSSFLEAKMFQAQTEVSLRKDFTRALFSSEGQLPTVQTRFATVFGAPIDVPYALLAVNGRPLESMQKIVRNRFHYLHETDTHTFLFWPFDPKEKNPLYGLPKSLEALPSALIPSYEGLSGLAVAAEHAILLAEQLTSDDTAPLLLDRDWPRIARNKLSSRGVHFSNELDGLLGIGHTGEAERIRDTVRLYLENGSIAETAATLFTHRNTILNRLRRFTELTNIDLRVPAESAKAVIAWLR